MSAAYNISGWWLLFTVIVYAVPIGVFLYERCWLRSLVSPVLTMLRRCPFYMMVAVALLFAQMVVRGSTKTNRNNSVEIELGGRTGNVINQNFNGGEQSDGGDDGLSGVVPVRSFDSTTLCFTGIDIATNGIILEVYCPTNIALPENTLDVYGASALELFDWNCLASYLVSGTNCAITVFWEDIPGYSPTNMPSRYFFAVGTRTDTDSDGLSDAYEHFVSDTRANNPDTDFDGLTDYEEMTLNLNPLDCDDAIQDPDSDGIPTLYEIRNGTNPNVSDYELAPKIRVGTNGVENLKTAFEISSPYSIIEIVPGIYEGSEWTGLWFPPHPIMLTGPVPWTGQKVILRHNDYSGLAAFYIDKASNTHTFVQNFTLDMSHSTARFLTGFWCGGNLPFTGESVSATFNNVIVRLATTDAINIGWFLRHANRTKMNISGCLVNARGASCARGIYAIDPSPLRIENCSFINFPPDGEKASYGIQLESTSPNYGGAVSNTPVEIVNCLFDESFTNAQPLAFLEEGISFDVNLHHSLMPFEPTNRVCGSDMVYANALTGISGLLASNSPAISAGVPSKVSKVDVNGGNRGLSPDIGAYQYIEEEDFGFDSDGDGLTDNEEIFTWNTDPTLYDTDGDGLGDGYELGHGSNPLDAGSVYAAFTIVVNYGDLIPGTTNYVAYGFSRTGWETNGLFHTTFATNTSFGVLLNGEILYAKLFCDLNRNGIYDEGTDMLLVRRVAVQEKGVTVTFEVGDSDGDGLGDGYELAHGSNPFDANSAFAAFTISVKYGLGVIPGMTNYVSYGFSTNCWETNGVFHTTSTTSRMFGIVLHGGELYAKLFCDLNRNGIYDEGTDILIVKPIAVCEEGSSVTFELGDIDGDGQSDKFEHEHGSNPVDHKSMWVQAKITVSNRDTGNHDVTNYLAYGFSYVGWEANGVYTFSRNPPNRYQYAFKTATGLAYVKVFRDFNRNGEYDPETDALHIAQIIVSGEEVFEQTITIGDGDGDGVPDAQEMQLGTDYLDRKSFCCDTAARIWNCFSGTNYLSFALATKVTGIIEPITPVTLATNSSMYVDYPHLSFTNAPGFYIVFFDDMNTNGIRDIGETMSYGNATLTNHNTVLELDMIRSGFDKDNDGILDRCEVEFGLSPSNPADAFSDSDGDGLINLHEYWMGCDKDIPDGTNTLLSIMARSIDERIAGKDPDEALPIYANYETATSAYELIPNTNCWAYGIDFSCCSMWNSITAQQSNHRWYAATAISPRHVIMGAHFGTPTSRTYYFMGRMASSMNGS